MKFLKMEKSFCSGWRVMSIVLLVFLSNAYIQPAYGENDVGKSLFNVNCAVCHGLKGDSSGQMMYNDRIEPSGKMIRIYPRDFTSAVFKFRTTPSGCLPLDSDILRVISNGITKSFMPSFNYLSNDKKMALLAYVKSFSTRWSEEPPCKPVAISKPSWLGSPESIARGEKIYKTMKCFECHGDTGKGDGSKSDKLKDDLGHQIYPFDFTSGILKRGAAPEDIYITFSTGVDGTPMPSYADSLNEEGRWDIVSFTMTLMKKDVPQQSHQVVDTKTKSVKK
ncbi:MAG: cytochrome c [Nitrospirae bacterium]|nr:cytochrome c [Nitrospirota bacterium]